MAHTDFYIIYGIYGANLINLYEKLSMVIGTLLAGNMDIPSSLVPS